MRAAWRKPPAPADSFEPPADAAFGDRDLEAEAGWVAVSSGAAANLTALVRWTAWALLVAGPAIGLYALVQTPAAAGAPAKPAAAPAVARDGAGPAGFAELYVAAYAQAGQGSEATLAPFFPGVRDVALDAKPGVQRVEQLAAVRVQAGPGGSWTVTVAAHLTGAAGKKERPSAGAETPGGVLRYFQVPVKASGAGGYVAAALPAEVAAPEPGEEVKLGFGPAVPADTSDAATTTVREFLAAYLTGTGELDRYLSPGTELSPVSPAPYKDLELAQLAERGGDFRSGLAAQEGVRRELRVDVNATDRAGQTRPLTYALALTARDGRWEISALDAASAARTTVKGSTS